MGKDPLKDYKKKRDFKKSTEPSGIKKRSRKKKLIFVVQEHHARNLHYDFRLEIDGVLKSWAIPKGPSLDPKDKRLAVQTEDHPLDYAKFAGTIPKGEYGAGKVLIWDHGTWESEEDDTEEALKKGHLEFSLNGRRLKGKWILVRTHYGEKETDNNWLLIKREDQKKVRSVKKKTPGQVLSQHSYQN
ncbi:MAG: DNA polymerase ligase N-terminal domain-containing protein [Bacteriovoracaceae bacterium]